jgi:streptogramin lyase
MVEVMCTSIRRSSRTFRRLFGRWFLKFLAVLCVGGVLGSALIFPLETRAVASPVKMFPLPAAPFDVKVGGGNRIWFTLPEANQIGSLEVIVSGTITQHLYTFYSLPTPNSQPYRLAVDSNYVWFTQKRGNRIGRLSINDGVITEYTVPTPASEPTGIDVAPDGRVWFVESKGDKVAVLTPSSGTIQEIDVGYSGTELDRIDATSASIIWMTAPGIEMLLGYRPDFNDFVSIQIVDMRPDAGPQAARGLSATSSGVPWISTKELPKVASYQYGTLAIWIWQTYPVENADLVDIVLWNQSGNTLLWTLDAVNREVLLIDAGTMRLLQRVRLGAGDSILTALAFDPVTQVVWIADAGRPALYAVEPPYTLQMHLPLVMR